MHFGRAAQADLFCCWGFTWDFAFYHFPIAKYDGLQTEQKPHYLPFYLPALTCNQFGALKRL
jgi:hypothetical protein